MLKIKIQKYKNTKKKDLRSYLRIALCISTTYDTLAFAKQLGLRQTNFVFFFSETNTGTRPFFIYFQCSDHFLSIQ